MTCAGGHVVHACGHLRGAASGAQASPSCLRRRPSRFERSSFLLDARDWPVVGGRHGRCSGSQAACPERPCLGSRGGLRGSRKYVLSLLSERSSVLRMAVALSQGPGRRRTCRGARADAARSGSGREMTSGVLRTWGGWRRSRPASTRPISSGSTEHPTLLSGGEIAGFRCPGRRNPTAQRLKRQRAVVTRYRQTSRPLRGHFHPSPPVTSGCEDHL